jgi:hypothetical protein
MIHVILVLFHLLFLRPHYCWLHFTRFVAMRAKSLQRAASKRAHELALECGSALPLSLKIAILATSSFTGFGPRAFA